MGEAVKNVFEDMPEVGTVVGKFDENELASLVHLNDLIAAYENTKGTEPQRLVELYKQRRELWMSVTKKNGVPYRWTISMDYETGLIYIGEDPRKK